jgi:hypothetical protein
VLDPAPADAVAGHIVIGAFDAIQTPHGIELTAVDSHSPPRLHPRTSDAVVRVSIRRHAFGENAGAPRERTTLLSADEQRILTLLGLLGGASLASWHIEAVSGVRDAGALLDALERRGWVRGPAPRFRLVHSSSPVSAPFIVSKLTAALLAHLTEYARHNAGPTELVAEHEAIETALDLAALDGRWAAALELVHACEPTLAHAGAWAGWRRVLLRGLESARALGDEGAEGHMRHQLGSLALCLGETREAQAQLWEALRIRQRTGEEEGVKVTRHNIGQLGAGGPFWGGASDPSAADDPDPRMHGSAHELRRSPIALLIARALRRSRKQTGAS